MGNLVDDVPPNAPDHLFTLYVRIKYKNQFMLIALRLFYDEKEVNSFPGKRKENGSIYRGRDPHLGYI